MPAPTDRQQAELKAVENHIREVQQRLPAAVVNPSCPANPEPCASYWYPTDEVMNPYDQARLAITRRHFFSQASTGIGVAALASLLTDDARTAAVGGLAGPPPLPARGEAHHLIGLAGLGLYRLRHSRR